MTSYIAILRGINVGGNRMIKMDALKELCSQLGFQKIQTYIQSGNIIFQVENAESHNLARQLTQAIQERFGFDVPTLIIEQSEFKQMVLKNPFLNDPSKDSSFLHVTFLADKPNEEDFNKIKNGNYGADEFHLLDRAIYLYCPNSYSNSKLTNGFFENKLKVGASTRNWKTIGELQNMVEKMING